MVIADRRAIDLEPFVEAIEMRRREQSRAHAMGAANAGAERGGRALAVRTGHDDRIALQPRAVHGENIEQRRQPGETNAVTVFRKIKHPTIPSPKTYDA